MAVQKLSQIAAAPGAPALTDTVIGVGGGTTDFQYTLSQILTTVSPTGANPTATASNSAVNGSATTFMRSDAAPAIQLASSSQFGIVEVDGTSITASSGVISTKPPGSTTQIIFNNAGAFGADSGLIYAGNGQGFTETYTGTAGSQQLFEFVATNLSGIAVNTGLIFTAADGASILQILQGNSGGGLSFRDWNSQDLLIISHTSQSGYWTILGTGASGTIGDILPQDNANSIGDATHNVKTIFNYTSQLKGVTIANLPASPVVGMVAHITDGDAGLAWGATAVNSGAGATHYLVWRNATNWTIAGK